MYALLAFLWLTTCIRLIASQALTAWHTSVGDQVVYQNASSTDLLYTIATGTGPGFGGFTAWTKLSLTVPPRNGTGLAGTGYTGGDGNLYGQVFYISSTGSIIEAIIKCTIPSGECILQGSYTISGSVTTGINPDTRLAATIRSANDGYRVFYHDTAGKVQQIRYSGPLNITWSHETPVLDGNQPSLAGLTTDGGENLTTYAIDSSLNIISAQLMNNGSFQQSTTLATQNVPAFNGTSVTLASTVSSNNVTKTLFYINTNGMLQQLSTDNDWEAWTFVTLNNTELFPLADQPNAPFAMASSYTVSSFYYFSGRSLVKTTLDNGKWQKAVSIFGKVSNSTTTEASKGSNMAAKLGAGLGFGIGAPLIAAFVALSYVFWTRRQDILRKRSMAPPVPEKDALEVDALTVVRHELGPEVKYELYDERGP